MSDSSPRARPVIALYTVALVALVADQATKVAAVAGLRPGRSVHALDGILYWTLQRNPGAAFSLFQKIPIAFTIIAFAIAAGIIIRSRRITDVMTAVALGLVLGGALGNLSDRMFRSPGPFRGHVIDFIDLRVWPTFNVADACVVTGAILLFLASVRKDRASRAVETP